MRERDGGPTGSAVWPPASQAQDGGLEPDLQGLGDQLLAAQLQALQLGSSSTSRTNSGAAGPAPSFQHLTGGAVSTRSGSPGTSTHGGGSTHSQQQHLDSSQLQLFAQLQLGGAGAMAPMPLPAGLLPAGLPPGSAAAAMAAAAMAQQQQQQQARVAGGRRRGGGRRNEEKVRRTIYISDISDAVSEAQLASFFADCGPLVDCRVCGDPNSSMRFAFIEFVGEEGAQQALSKSGSVLGDFPIRVSPSKTAIVPVNNTYLPRSSDERELVARTVFVGNIDRVVEREQLREFFENLCGPVSKIRLLGDAQHTSKIAFVEFMSAEGARGALKLSGALLGTLPLRVSPSKTPVRVDSRRNHDDRNSALGNLHRAHAATMQQTGIPAAGLHAGGLQQQLFMPAGLPAVAMPGAAMPSAGVPAAAGMLQPPGGHAHAQLPPALLMAVAGLQMGYPGMPPFSLS